ncbi:MAG: hypothetical protein RL095_2872 [Verrucomicrobiota bacterium]|jgi:hypothetical protein
MIFPIRHHGPGCARALLRSLEALRPAQILIEGPPDADELIPLLAKEGFVPPVALLVYEADSPEHAAFYPFTHFSPEWIALNWAVKNGVPVRFFDLPACHSFALEKKEEEPADPTDLLEAPQLCPSGVPAVSQLSPCSIDPIAQLAAADGCADSDAWWDSLAEQRGEDPTLFEAILEGMRAVREKAPPATGREALREAWMRREMRKAQKELAEGAELAVICGAWHAPALENLPAAKVDNELLKGLAKVKIEASWVPWSARALSFKSGYGAGCESPGYYQMLWDRGADTPLRWITRCAQLLRERDLDAATSSSIDALRLAQTLATLRHRRQPGLSELREALLATFCRGDLTPMSLIRDELEVGHAFGAVPEGVPRSPLESDFAALCKSHRLKIADPPATLELDLRKEAHLERSRFLHRLRLLGIPWGQLGDSRSTGTFKEAWNLSWQPEFVVKLVTAAPLGNTIEQAAIAKTLLSLNPGTPLPQLSALIDGAFLAALPTLVDKLVEALANQAATAADALALMQALPPLAGTLRYGDVRGSPPASVAHLVETLFERALLALPQACRGIDEEAAAIYALALDSTTHVLDTLELKAQQRSWQLALAKLARDRSAHPLLQGRALRQLLAAQGLSPEDAATDISFALSGPVDAAAHWLSGFVSGPALALLHLEVFWPLLNTWVDALEPERFTELLPILRRAFADFSTPERRHIADKVKNLRSGTSAPAAKAVAETANYHPERAALVLPLLKKILVGP